jgi:hypothetical protein
MEDYFDPKYEYLPKGSSVRSNPRIQVDMESA